MLDRFLMKIETHKRRARISFRHHEGRGAVAATDVRHLGSALKFLRHAVERRQPLGYEVDLISRAKEFLSAAKETFVVVAPSQALAAPKCVSHLGFIDTQRADCVKAADHARRAIGIGEHGLLLRAHAEAVRLLIIADVARSRLSRAPFADIPFGRICSVG